MRILFTSARGLGHLYPLLPLARAARLAGDEVHFAVPATLVEAVRRHGFPVSVTATGRATPPAPHGSTAPDPITGVFQEHFAGAVVRENLPPLRRVLAGWQPDVVVSEVMNFAGPLAADAAGLPYVPVGVNALRVRHVHLDVVTAPLNAVRRRLGLPETPDLGWLFRHRYPTAFPAVLEHLDLVRPATTLAYRHADPDGHTPSPPPREPAPRRPRRRTVYASLGTEATQGDKHLPAHVTTLAALGLVDADVLFTVGGLDRAGLGLLPANVRLADHLPPRVAMDCDVVLTHAGAGTTTAALSRGLPLVCLPLFGDQPHNAARVSAVGAGLAVEPEAGPRDVAAALDEVLGDPSYAATAQDLARTMATAPTVDAVVAALHDLATDTGGARLAG